MGATMYMSGSGIHHLSGLTTLTSLSLEGVDDGCQCLVMVNDDTLRRNLFRLSRLEYLKLQGMEHISPKGENRRPR